MYFVGLDSLFTLLSSLNLYQYSLYYSIAICALVLSIFFDSLIWHSLLQPLDIKITARKLMLYNWVGNFVEMVIPCETVCGEVTRIYLSQKETNNNTGTAAATVITSRMISTFVYTGGLLIGFVSLILTHQLPMYLLTPVILVSVGTVGAIGAILYIALKEGAAEKLVNFLTRIIKIVTKNQASVEKRKEKLQESLYSFSEAFKTYKKYPKFLLKPVIFAVIAWMFSLIVYLMVFYSLNYTGISLLDLATVYCIATTVETLTAGFPVGAVEVTMINLYSLYGVPIVIAAAATTLSRLLTFWCQVLVGYPMVQWLGLKPLIQKSMEQEELIPKNGTTPIP
jgi:uncharacterized protein (TIRG00374 family)